MTLRVFLAVLAVGLAMRPAFAADRPTSGAPVTVRVMSFNIRYGTAKDGEDRWEKRQDFLVETIRAYNPDLLGTQEVLAEQADFLKQRLPEYGFVGAGRDDGQRKGEFSPIMFRSDRYELLAHGQWWLSPTPEKVGSRGWDAALPRVVTWARLKDRPSGVTILYYNTHWDHQGNVARVESGKLMRKLIEDSRGDAELPVIVTGDFNSTEETPQYKSLTVGDGTGLKLMDAYREVHPQHKGDEASFNGFKGTKQGMRIDWVLHSPQWTAKGAAIDRTERNGHTPSDHYPVTAELELKR
jgi:endonuclease/exonuclease/phosphatase family metal-dependent hydrolase